jgi:hypothetical protein
MCNKDKDAFYIESTLSQSKDIYLRTKVQTFSIETMQLFGATNIGYKYHPAFEGFLNLEHPQLSNTFLGSKIEQKGNPNWLFK